MADYLVTGKKGNGKSIFGVGAIREALIAGKRVATNLDIDLVQLTHARAKCSIIRLPDSPEAEDMEALGRGQDGVCEEDNGVIVIDEASKILGARTWNDDSKARAKFLDWLVHSRKLGWDVYMIAQGVSQLDKQLRQSLLEYHVHVTRTDKWPLPFIGWLGKLRPSPNNGPLTWPKFHVGTVRQGFDQGALIVNRRWYRGAPLHSAYQTQQVFLSKDHPKACGLHTVLSPWLTTGRYLPVPQQAFMARLRAWWNRKPAQAQATDKHRLVKLLERLPPDQRLKHWQRLNDLGAFA